MGNWYRVVKTIKGHRYAYLQQTYREGNRVRTRNHYLGPAGSETAASGSAGGESEPAGGTAGIASAVVGGLAGFGKEAVRQFDAPRWGTDAASQLGLGNENKKPKGKTVTTTKRPRRRTWITGRAPFYDPEDVSPSGGMKSVAIEKVFSRIPEGTTDPGGYIVKRNGKLFPTAKLTAELQAWIGIAQASDGSIIDGPHINKTGFTQDVALQRAAQPTDTPASVAVTTTNASSDEHPDNAAQGGNPSRSNVHG